MSQQVQELINKIKQEGIQEAGRQAQDIKNEAQKQAQAIVAEAKAKADQAVKDAQDRIKKMEESSQKALQHASRDTILSLRKQIENVLKAIISKEVGNALNVDQISGIISDVIKASVDNINKDASVDVSLNEKDAKALSDNFLAKLQKSLKEPIRIQPSTSVSKGFTISFDSGKSSFEFTDESLAEYFSSFVNTQLSAIIKEAIRKS